MVSDFQGSEWRGRVGDVWAAEWRRTDRSFSELTPHLNAAILDNAPDRGRAIDLGCGAGETAIALASVRPEMTVTGIDLSPNLIAVARQRAAGIANVAFQTGDTAALDPTIDVDLFVSRHGVMFFDDPAAAFTAIRHAAAPDAAMVFSCFAARLDNQWVQLLDAVNNGAPAAGSDYLPGPFAFADPDFTADVLARAGWSDAAPRRVAFDYIAGKGADPITDAVDFFVRIGPAARVIADAAAERRTMMIDRLAKSLADHEIDGKVKLRAAAWIWTARNPGVIT